MESKIVAPAVNTAVLQGGKILLTRRSAKVREPGKWCIPGGHLDFGESWETAAIRELKEETGLVARKTELYGAYSDPNLTITQELVEGKYRKQFVTLCFLVTDFSGDIAPNDEVDDWGWYEFNDLPNPILKSHPIRIEDALRFQGKVFVR